MASGRYGTHVAGNGQHALEAGQTRRQYTVYSEDRLIGDTTQYAVSLYPEISEVQNIELLYHSGFPSTDLAPEGDPVDVPPDLGDPILTLLNPEGYEMWTVDLDLIPSPMNETASHNAAKPRASTYINNPPWWNHHEDIAQKTLFFMPAGVYYTPYQIAEALNNAMAAKNFPGGTTFKVNVVYDGPYLAVTCNLIPAPGATNYATAYLRMYQRTFGLSFTETIKTLGSYDNQMVFQSILDPQRVFYYPLKNWTTLTSWDKIEVTTPYGGIVQFANEFDTAFYNVPFNITPGSYDPSEIMNLIQSEIDGQPQQGSIALANSLTFNIVGALVNLTFWMIGNNFVKAYIKINDDLDGWPISGRLRMNNLDDNDRFYTWVDFATSNANWCCPAPFVPGNGDRRGAPIDFIPYVPDPWSTPYHIQPPPPPTMVKSNRTPVFDSTMKEILIAMSDSQVTHEQFNRLSMALDQRALAVKKHHLHPRIVPTTVPRVTLPRNYPMLFMNILNYQVVSSTTKSKGYDFSLDNDDYTNTLNVVSFRYNNKTHFTQAFTPSSPTKLIKQLQVEYFADDGTPFDDIPEHFFIIEVTGSVNVPQ